MNGLTSLPSRFGPEETVKRFEAEIGNHGMTVFARINHAALAAEVELSLRPTEVILFGNPRAGTPLMQMNQTIGIDLPLKALVHQDASGQTWLSYNEPPWLVSRHGIGGAEQVVAVMTKVVGVMAATAAGVSQ